MQNKTPPDCPYMLDIHRRKYFVSAVLAWAVLGLAVGCGWRLRRGPPGTVYQQRNDAVLHDPFPSNVSGPPIEGARPREYAMPPAEPKRIQISPYAQH
jgi:hypothetical protein